MYRMFLGVVILGLFVVGLAAQPVPRVPLFVSSVGEMDGWTDPNKGNQDSVKDLQSWISHDYRKTLVIAPTREEATIVLIVLGREQQNITPGLFGGGNNREYALRVKLLAPAHGIEAELVATASGGTLMSGGAWYGAAGKIAWQVETWVVANRARLAELQTTEVR